MILLYFLYTVVSFIFGASIPFSVKKKIENLFLKLRNFDFDKIDFSQDAKLSFLKWN